MKFTYDHDADAAYIRIMDVTRGAVKESEEVRPGVIVDFDQQGRMVGIELLSVSKLYPDFVRDDLQRLAAG